MEIYAESKEDLRLPYNGLDDDGVTIKLIIYLRLFMPQESVIMGVSRPSGTFIDGGSCCKVTRKTLFLLICWNFTCIRRWQASS